MNGYQGTGSRGNGVKEVVLLVVFLLIAAFCVGGVIIGDSYLGNPAREDAEAERTRIVNKDLEIRQQIDREAYRQQKEDEAQARREQAQQSLKWQERWNELGTVLATAAVVGLLTITGIRIAAPVVAQAYERYAYCRAQLVEQQRKLEERRAKALQEARRLEEVRLQRYRVGLVHSQNGGNGREQEFSLEQSRTTSSQKADVSAIQRSN